MSKIKSNQKLETDLIKKLLQISAKVAQWE